MIWGDGNYSSAYPGVAKTHGDDYGLPFLATVICCSMLPVLMKVDLWATTHVLLVGLGLAHPESTRKAVTVTIPSSFTAVSPMSCWMFR